MRIVIDMQGTQNGSRFRGIGRYIKAFVKHLIQVAKRHEIVLAFSSEFPETLDPLRAEFGSLVGSENIHVWQPVTPAQFADSHSTARRLASELIREAFLVSLRPDVVLVASLFEGFGDGVFTSIGRFPGSPPVAVIFYDLIPHIYPDQYLGTQQLKEWYNAKLECLKHARVLLAISRSAANEAIQLLGTDSRSVAVISSAAESMFRTEKGVSESDLRKKFAISQPFLLYTGASDFRKNLSRLIEAFSLLSPETRNGFQLVLAGAISNTDLKQLQMQASKVKLPKYKVLFLGHVTDGELIGLYRAARACVMPSFHEGFGLPVLEAMNCGAPVIGSNETSIPEVVGLDEALFDPHSTVNMSAAIERVLVDEPFRSRLIEHAKSHCENFSWELVAKRGLAALEEIVDPEPSHTGENGPMATHGILETLIPMLGRTLAEHGAIRGDYIKVAEAVEVNFPE